MQSNEPQTRTSFLSGQFWRCREWDEPRTHSPARGGSHAVQSPPATITIHKSRACRSIIMLAMVMHNTTAWALRLPPHTQNSTSWPSTGGINVAPYSKYPIYFSINLTSVYDMYCMEYSTFLFTRIHAQMYVQGESCCYLLVVTCLPFVV